MRTKYTYNVSHIRSISFWISRKDVVNFRVAKGANPQTYELLLYSIHGTCALFCKNPYNKVSQCLLYLNYDRSITTVYTYDTIRYSGVVMILFRKECKGLKRIIWYENLTFHLELFFKITKLYL